MTAATFGTSRRRRSGGVDYSDQVAGTEEWIEARTESRNEARREARREGGREARDDVWIDDRADDGDSVGNRYGAERAPVGSDPAPRRSLSEMTLRERKRAAMERITGEPMSDSAARYSVAANRKPPEALKISAIDVNAQPPGVYYVILAIVAVFVLLGLVMVLSATSTYQMSIGRSPYRIFVRQVIWGAIGVAAAVVVSRISYQRWLRLVYPAFLGSLGLMIATFVPGVGMTLNGARSWLRVGPLSFQPSELMKLAIVAMLATYYHKWHGRVAEPRYGIYPLAVIVGLGAGVAFVQGDLGSAIVMGAVGLSVGMIAGVPLVHLGTLTVSAAVMSGFAIVTDSRRMDRVTAFLDPQGNKDHLSWQSWQSRLSIANGGLTGSGIGGSKAKLGYLPYAHSDFIFAVVADELGAIGAVAVIGGFILLVYCGMQVALAAPDRFGMLLAGGISAWFGVQAMVHLGGVAGVMPVTGLTLPFFSAGGSSLLVSMVAAAFLLNIARRAVTVDG